METKYGFTTTKSRSELMKKIRATDTKAEVRLRKKLWALGYRYRKNYALLPGKPDIVFLKSKVVVFIDGEFWHGYNWIEKKQKIKSNRAYWIEKIEKNIERDKKNNTKLEEMGFTVCRFWEKEIKKDIESCIQLIVANIEK